MRKRYDFEYLVIGSGASGRVGALMSAGAGLKTAVIEAETFAGIGSKRELSSILAMNFVRKLHQVNQAKQDGIYLERLQYDYPSVIQKRIEKLQNFEQISKHTFQSAGITCISGKARFLDSHTVKVSDQTYTAEKILLATGAKPINPGIVGLDSVSFMMPENVFRLKRLPKSVFVIGAGATGCEIAQYFSELGSRVILADLSARILPQEDEEVGQLMEDYFSNYLHIKVLKYARASRVEQDQVSKKVFFIQNGKELGARTDLIVLATGMAPATDLDLEKAGIKTSNGKIEVTSFLQTSVKHIFVAGDLAGGKISTEKSEYEAALATANLINRAKNSANYDGFARRVDTFPQVVTIGRQEDDCLREDLQFRKILIESKDVLSAKLQDYQHGFVKVILNKQNKILGATVVSKDADLIIQELALAMRHGLSFDIIANTPHISTSLTEMIRVAARRI